MNLGSPAPELVLRTDHGRALTSADVLGRPWVLAFVRAWSPTNPDVDLAAIRAELRGLGAELVVVSEAGVWSFRPDDDVELWSVAASEQLAADVAAATRRYGVAPGQDAVFVIDAAGAIRFAHVAEGALATRLGVALAAAGRELVDRRLDALVTFSRREWIVASLCAGFALAFATGCRRRNIEGTPAPETTAPAANELDVVLNVNGKDHALRIDPRTSLLDALRERLGLTGTKKGCDHGQCGACTVLVDGKRLLGCLTLAAMTEGTTIVTVEGLATGDALHPMQEAFIAHDGLQCGYCTPGQILSAIGCVAEGHTRSDEEIREHMSGNLCRCGAYPNIVAAIRAAAKAGPA